VLALSLTAGLIRLLLTQSIVEGSALLSGSLAGTDGWALPGKRPHAPVDDAMAIDPERRMRRLHRLVAIVGVLNLLTGLAAVAAVVTFMEVVKRVAQPGRLVTVTVGVAGQAFVVAAVGRRAAPATKRAPWQGL
jgi:hypothetical protein